MSRSVNPARIGLFVVVGFVLAVGTLLYVGSVRLFQNEIVFLTYFKESVNGLSVGSPVKFKGVAIGTVSDIRLNYNQDPSLRGSYIPVFIKINESKLRAKEGEMTHVDIADWNEFALQVRNGLRARLQLESIITGQLFIELDYFAEPGTDFRLVQAEVEYREIPSMPSVMAEIGSSASEILASVGTIDLKEIGDGLSELIRKLNLAVDELDVAQWNQSLVTAGGELERILTDLDFKPTLDRAATVLDDLSSVSRQLDSGLPEVVADYHRIIAELSSTLERGNRVLDNLDTFTAPDAGVQRELLKVLRDLQSAARAARELMTFLDRNPRALLTGRNSEEP
jgi:paraquat-inducible protein B